MKEVFNEEEVFDEEQREKLKIRLYNDFQKQLENTMLIPFVDKIISLDMDSYI